MAVPSTPVGLRTEVDGFHPRWPTRGIDPGEVWADYDAVADELLVYFGGGPTSAVNVPIDAPDQDSVDLLVEEESEAVVGLQVDALRSGVGRAHPRWAALADDDATSEQRRDAITALIVDAAGLFALYGAGA